MGLKVLQIFYISILTTFFDEKRKQKWRIHWFPHHSLLTALETSAQSKSWWKYKAVSPAQSLIVNQLPLINDSVLMSLSINEKKYVYWHKWSKLCILAIMSKISRSGSIKVHHHYKNFCQSYKINLDRSLKYIMAK